MGGKKMNTADSKTLERKAIASKNFGDGLLTRFDLLGAHKSYEVALALYTQLDEVLGQANVLKAIGDVKYARSDRDAALKSYEQALALYTQLDEVLGQANVLKAIGDVK